MTDLLTWLNGVLDQVEATAKAWPSEQRSWRAVGARHLTFDNGSREQVAAIDVQASEPDQWDRIWVKRAGAQRGIAEHIAMHDPAAVLADITAKRAIVELHTGAHECSSYDPVSRDFNNCVWIDADSLCSTLRLLASASSTWPGYQTEWAPEETP